jgi:hypothetical protein
MQNDRIDVIGILGTSFSGSTLLNLMLGAHPSIYAGGELSALILNRGDPAIASCTACGIECRYWTGTARSEVTKASLYTTVQQVFGKRVIVDSSKSIDWFREVLASPEHEHCVPSYVLMVKHPIRYLASCLTNIWENRSGTHGASLFAKRSIQEERDAFFDEQVELLQAFYQGFFRTLDETAAGATFHLVHYERLVADAHVALMPILGAVSLAHLPQMDDFFRAEFHQIGGNAGPLYQAGQGWPKGHEPSMERKKFYEASASLRIDDKYRQSLTARELSRLKAHPTVRALCDRLGYDAPDMPFAIQ